MAPQRDEIFKQKVNDCVQHIILQKFTNLHAIRSWNFQNICTEIGWPRFLRHPVYMVYNILMHFTRETQHFWGYCNFLQATHCRNRKLWSQFMFNINSWHDMKILFLPSPRLTKIIDCTNKFETPYFTQLTRDRPTYIDVHYCSSSVCHACAP